MKRRVINFAAVVRGSASRAFAQMLMMVAIGATGLAAALWLFAKDSRVVKFAAFSAFVTFAAMVAVVTTLLSATAVARIRDGMLEFRFCGIRTRSFPLEDTTFELRQLGRCRVLQIYSGRSRYTPNGALDANEVAELLRANGVPERSRE